MRTALLCSAGMCVLLVATGAAAQDEDVAPLDEGTSDEAMDQEDPADLGDPAPAPAPAMEESSLGGRTANNAIYLELLGNALFYSIDYERFFTDDIAGRIGMGYFSVTATASGGGSTAEASASIMLIPVMINYLGIGSADHKLELGIGALVIYASASVDTLAAEADGSGVGIVGTSSFAYRYVPHDGGFNFKAGLMPTFGSFGFLPWFGFAFGAVF